VDKIFDFKPSKKIMVNGGDFREESTTHLAVFEDTGLIILHPKLGNINLHLDIGHMDLA